MKLYGRGSVDDGWLQLLAVKDRIKIAARTDFFVFRRARARAIRQTAGCRRMEISHKFYVVVDDNRTGHGGKRLRLRWWSHFRRSAARKGCYIPGKRNVSAGAISGLLFAVFARLHFRRYSSMHANT